MNREPGSGETGEAESVDSVDSGVQRGRDELFRLLAERRRRQVAAHLVVRGEPVSLGALVDHLGGTLGTERRSVEIALVHVDLPWLSDSGVVEYDRHERTIRPGPELDDVVPYIDPELRVETEPTDR